MSSLSRRTVLGKAGTIVELVPRRGETRAPHAQELVNRTSQYIDCYDREMRAVVAEARYRQELTSPVSGTVTRELVSEIGWLRLEGLDDAIAMRDVLEVDGRATGREHSLRRLLENPAAAADSRVSKLGTESRDDHPLKSPLPHQIGRGAVSVRLFLCSEDLLGSFARTISPFNPALGSRGPGARGHPHWVPVVKLHVEPLFTMFAMVLPTTRQ